MTGTYGKFSENQVRGFFSGMWGDDIFPEENKHAGVTFKERSVSSLMKNDERPAVVLAAQEALNLDHK